MASHELTCQELVELVTDYLEDSLPLPDRHRFEKHLADCQGCRTYINQMQTTVQLTGTLTEEAIDPQARDTLLQVFRAWNSSGAV